MPKKYTILIEKDEDNCLVSEVVELHGCHTQAETLDELIVRTKEAIKAYLNDSSEEEHSETFIDIQNIEV